MMINILVEFSKQCWNRWQWGRSPRRPGTPRIVVEISSRFLSVATCKGRPPQVVGFAARDLPEGRAKPSPSRPHIEDPEQVGNLLESALKELGIEGGECALLVPDVTVRVATFTVESLPWRRSELDQYLLWRMKETLPFNASDAVASYQIHKGSKGLEVLVGIMARPVLEKYESVLQRLDLEPFWILPASLALVSMVPDDDNSRSMLVHRDGQTLTCAVPENDQMGFYRCRTLGDEPSLFDPRFELVTAEVLPLLRHWENTQGSRIHRISFCARGGVGQKLVNQLRENLGLPVHPLSFEDRISSDCSPLARNLFARRGAPVAGLLANLA